MDWWREERLARAEGYLCIAGVDEAGRGALAGPVVAASVILPAFCAPAGLDDSKALTPASREWVYERIVAQARGIGVGVVDSGRVDEINVLEATHEAMRLAIGDLPGGLRPDVALIDGLPVRPFPLDQIALVKGDSRSASVAAASVVAKVTRDRIMRELHHTYPDYGFSDHKGYGVPAHLRALQEHGPCPQHRRSFRPVLTCMEQAGNPWGSRPG